MTDVTHRCSRCEAVVMRENRDARWCTKCGKTWPKPRCTVPYSHGPHTVDNGRLQTQCEGKA